MELRHLEYFVAVAEEANFTRAAQRLHVAQPAISAQLQKLERELGQPLLDRSRRQTRVTAAGAEALPYARAALKAVADMRGAVDDLGDLVRGTVAIGTVTAHHVDLPALLESFHRAHPGVEITLGTDNSAQLIDALRAGRLDLAIVSIGSDEHPDGLGCHVVTDERIDAVVGLDDPWAARRRVTVAELADRPLIALPPGTGIRQRIEEACARSGLQPRVAFEADTPQALAELAARGLGVAVVPESVSASRDDVRVLRITPQLRGRLVLAWRTAGPINPAARVLLGMARQLLRVGATA